MLVELNIKNLAIIDELLISFSDGLNVISGETGAGKSIIIGAIGLLLGGRASADSIRSSEDWAVVEARFDISEKKEIKKMLTQAGRYAGDDLVLKRVVSRSGKNKAYLNGRLATLSVLSSLSGLLVNVCGQQEHQVLLNADNHIDILDEFEGLLPLRSDYFDLYNEYLLLLKKIDDLKSTEKNKQEREELLRFQCKEIEDMQVKDGEDNFLMEEKNLLSNAKKLKEYAEEAYNLLYMKKGSILEEFSRVISLANRITEIHRDFGISAEELNSILYRVEEASYILRDYSSTILFNRDRLEEIDDRLQLLGNLKRKYGGTIDAILQRKEEIEEEISTISSLEQEIKRLSDHIAHKKKMMLEKACLLTQKRHDAARALKDAVEQEIKEMRMENTRFEVIFFSSSSKGENEFIHFNSKGLDILEFYLSTNIGENLKPLNRIASGGELSRIILAIKKVLARAGSLSTVIFDEVDSGISGATAEIVGKKLRDVSKHHQVICITHLPQIASFGNTHFLVSKEVSGGRTNAKVNKLSEMERLDEITRMLGGVELTDTTRKHARELLETCVKGT